MNIDVTPLSRRGSRDDRLCRMKSCLKLIDAVLTSREIRCDDGSLSLPEWVQEGIAGLVPVLLACFEVSRPCLCWLSVGRITAECCVQNIAATPDVERPGVTRSVRSLEHVDNFPRTSGRASPSCHDCRIRRCTVSALGLWGVARRAACVSV